MRKYITFILLSIFFAGCASSATAGTSTQSVSIDASTLHLRYIVVDGMPCLKMASGSTSGITCDWSRWNGTVEDGKIILLP